MAGHVRPLTPSERSKLKRRKPLLMSMDELAGLWPRIWRTMELLEGEGAEERERMLNDPEMSDAPVRVDCVPQKKDLPGQSVAFLEGPCG